MGRLAMAAAASVVAMTLVACSPDEDLAPTHGSNFAAVVAEARAEAQKQNASAAQLALLDEVAAAGEVTMEQLLAARAPYEECLAALGYTLLDSGVTNAFGFPYPDYRIALPEDGENEALLFDCEIKNFRFIDMLYQTQPTSTQSKESTFVAAMPSLITCLNSAGLTIREKSPRMNSRTSWKKTSGPKWTAASRPATASCGRACPSRESPRSRDVFVGPRQPTPA